MKKRILAAGFILLMLTISGCSSSNLVLEGIVETTIYSQYCEVSGKISKLPVELGQKVKAGDVIAEIDDSNEQYALAQLKAVLAKKQAILDELKTGATSSEIKQGQNNVTLAEIAYQNAQLTKERVQKDFENARILLGERAISQSELDNAKYQAELADSALAAASVQLDNARQKLTLLREGARKEKITAAEADVKQTESQISQSQANLAKYKIQAVADGTIISKNYLLGNMVASGYNLADIAAEAEKVLVAYLPEDYLNKVSYGQELVIKSGERESKGTVCFIDMKAQYTPKDMQTSANKNKESIKIKVRLGSDSLLKVGERAEVVINL